MTILITGGNGCIAKELKILLNVKYNILNPARTELDILDFFQIDQFIKNNNVEYIIHTAVRGGSRLKNDSAEDMYQNILMFENIKKASFENNVKLLINISSGATFDRKNSIDCFSEEQILNIIPKDYYGLSKNIIDKLIYNYNQEQTKIVNLRIFGIFNINEIESRFIKSILNRIYRNEKITIYNDIYFDYIGMEDFHKIVEYIIENHLTLPYYDINSVYCKKYKLSDILNKTLELTTQHATNVEIINSDGNNYTGSFRRLNLLDINLDGFEQSLTKYIQLYKKANNISN